MAWSVDGTGPTSSGQDDTHSVGRHQRSRVGRRPQVVPDVVERAAGDVDDARILHSHFVHQRRDGCADGCLFSGAGTAAAQSRLAGLLDPSFAKVSDAAVRSAFKFSFLNGPQSRREPAVSHVVVDFGKNFRSDPHRPTANFDG